MKGCQELHGLDKGELCVCEENQLFCVDGASLPAHWKLNSRVFTWA